MITHLCEGLQALANDRGLYLHLQGPGTMPVEGDALKLRRIAQNLVDLFTTSAISALEDRAALGAGASATAFLRITEWIGRHLRDGDLTPARIAAENFISVRKLQVLFQQHGTTVSSWIRERRLGESRRELALPSQALRSIGEIARGCGFEDQAAFSRAFRREFGETPRQWRTRALNYPSVGDRRPLGGDDGSVAGE